MAHLDHLEAEVLPDDVVNDVYEGAAQGNCDHVHRVLKRLLLLLLQPGNDEAHQEWRHVLLELQHEADDEELDERGVVRHQHAPHEGESVLRVLADVVLDVLFQRKLLLLDAEAVWKLTVLLELYLLVQAALKQRPGVAVE